MASETSLARERTSLAWTRTALAFAALAGIVYRAGVMAGAAAPAYVLGGLLLLVAVGAAGYGAKSYRASGAERMLQRPQALKLIASATFVLGVAAFALALLS